MLTCTDIVQLSQWKGVLEEKIAQAKISIGNIRSKGKGRLSSEELSRVNLLIENRAGNKRFLSLIMGRIREIFFLTTSNFDVDPLLVSKLPVFI